MPGSTRWKNRKGQLPNTTSFNTLMIVYQSTKAGFHNDVLSGDIEGIILDRFKKQLHRKVGKNEIQSWKSSLLYMHTVLTDVRIQSGGVEYIAQLRAIAPGCPIVVMASFHDEPLRAAVLQAGATAYITKPVHLTELRLCLRALISSVHQPIK